MKRALLRGNRRLLLRSYLVIVAGLLAVTFGLQLAYDYLLSANASDPDRWLKSTLELLAADLASVSPDQRQRRAAELSGALGIGVRVLQKEEIATSTPVDLEQLVSEDGEVFYLYAPPSLDQLVYVGPIASPRERWLTRSAPLLFYSSIFILVGLWLRPIFKDINRMTSAAQRFAADYRAPLHTADSTTELQPLAQNLDDMSQRLSSLIQSQKELIAALSHEMRTPLARIRFALAVIGNQAGEGMRERLADINADVQEIDELIATMLSYARLDHPDLQMDWRRVPLEAWLEQTAEKYRGPTKSLAIEREPGLDDATMDPRLMTLAASNLLSNAQRHASANIRLRIRRYDDGYELSVDDDGSGVPETARDTVFKAFTRLDDSRSRDTGGYGLGLAIVSRIAALHGGSASVASSADLGGAAFVLRWPQRAWVE